MGDFAAGKVIGKDGVAMRQLETEDVVQAMKDLEGQVSKKAPDHFKELQSHPPASEEELKALASLGVPPLVLAALGVRNGGLLCFDFRLLSCADIASRAKELGGGLLTIGTHFDPEDGTVLAVDSADGCAYEVCDGNKQQVEVLGQKGAMSFGEYLVKFGDALLRKKVEWAEGWVQVE